MNRSRNYRKLNKLQNGETDTQKKAEDIVNEVGGRLLKHTF